MRQIASGLRVSCIFIEKNPGFKFKITLGSPFAANSDRIALLGKGCGGGGAEGVAVVAPNNLEENQDHLTTLKNTKTT